MPLTLSDIEKIFNQDIKEKSAVNRRPSRPAKKRPRKQWSPETDEFRPFIHIDIQTGEKYLFHWPLPDSRDEWPSRQRDRGRLKK